MLYAHPIRSLALFGALALTGGWSATPANSAETLKGTFRGTYTSEVTSTGGNVTLKVSKYQNVPRQPTAKVVKGDLKIGTRTYKGAGVFLADTSQLSFTGFYKKGRQVFTGTILVVKDSAGVLSGEYVLGQQGQVTDNGTVVLQR